MEMAPRAADGGLHRGLKGGSGSCSCFTLRHASTTTMAGSLSRDKLQLYPVKPLIADACLLHGRNHHQARADPPESLLRTSGGTDTVRPSNSGWEGFLPFPSLTLASVSQLKRVAISLQGAEACLFAEVPQRSKDFSNALLKQTHTASSMTMLPHETVKQMARLVSLEGMKHLCFSALTSVPSPRTFCSFVLRSRSSDAFLLPSFAGVHFPSLGTTVTKDRMLLFLPMWVVAGRLTASAQFVKESNQNGQQWPPV